MVYIDMGPEESCFVQFCDGSQQWAASACLIDAPHGHPKPVELLIFAPSGGWFLLWGEDGGSDWEGLPTWTFNQVRRHGPLSTHNLTAPLLAHLSI